MNHWSHPPTLPYHIKCSNTMDMISLAQIRQSNGYGSVSNDNIFNLHLGSATGPQVSVPASCKTQATSIASILPNNHPRGKKNPKKRCNSQQIVLYYLGLCTKNPVLREVDLERSPKRANDKINRLRPRRKDKVFYSLDA